LWLLHREGSEIIVPGIHRSNRKTRKRLWKKPLPSTQLFLFLTVQSAGFSVISVDLIPELKLRADNSARLKPGFSPDLSGVPGLLALAHTLAFTPRAMSIGEPALAPALAKRGMQNCLNLLYEQFWLRLPSRSGVRMEGGWDGKWK
jgi:hypothetical protein